MLYFMGANYHLFEMNIYYHFFVDIIYLRYVLNQIDNELINFIYQYIFTIFYKSKV